MNIQIESPQIRLQRSLIRYLRHRLDQDLAFCRQRVHRVRVKFARMVGGYDGLGTQCQLIVSLSGGGEIIARSAESDLYVAIRRAADRLPESISRRLKVERESGSVVAARVG